MKILSILISCALLLSGCGTTSPAKDIKIDAKDLQSYQKFELPAKATTNEAVIYFIRPYSTKTILPTEDDIENDAYAKSTGKGKSVRINTKVDIYINSKKESALGVSENYYLKLKSGPVDIILDRAFGNRTAKGDLISKASTYSEDARSKSKIIDVQAGKVYYIWVGEGFFYNRYDNNGKGSINQTLYGSEINDPNAAYLVYKTANIN